MLDKLDDVEVHIVGGVVGWSELLSGRVDITSSKEGWSTNFQCVLLVTIRVVENLVKKWHDIRLGYIY